MKRQISLLLPLMVSLAVVPRSAAFLAPAGLSPLLRTASPVSKGYASVGLRLRNERPQAAVFAGRMAPVQLNLRMEDSWNEAKVVSNTQAADGLNKIVLNVGSDIAKSFKTPGQYVKARKDSSQEKPGFFAIASAPGATADTFEFLIKKTDGSAWICDAAEGSTVEVTDGQGNGYKYASALGDDVKNLILLATGSGIAPLKAVVESGDMKKFDSATLYYGARTPETMAYKDLFDEWKSSGVEVVPVISKPDGTGWDGRTGYIQECMKADGIKSGESTAALLCGVNDMVKEAKGVLSESGVPDGNVLMNF